MRAWRYCYRGIPVGVMLPVRVFTWKVPTGYTLLIDQVVASSGYTTESPFEYQLRENDRLLVDSTCRLNDKVTMSPTSWEIRGDRELQIDIYQEKEEYRYLNVFGTLQEDINTVLISSGWMFASGQYTMEYRVPAGKTFLIDAVKARSCVSSPATMEHRFRRKTKKKSGAVDFVAGFTQLTHPSNVSVSAKGLAQRFSPYMSGEIALIEAYCSMPSGGKVQLILENLSNPPVFEAEFGGWEGMAWAYFGVPMVMVKSPPTDHLCFIVLKGEISTVALNDPRFLIPSGRLYVSDGGPWVDSNMCCMPFRTWMSGYDYDDIIGVVNGPFEATPMINFNKPISMPAGEVVCCQIKGKGIYDQMADSFVAVEYMYGTVREKTIAIEDEQ